LTNQIFTIGHSNHTTEKFLDLLRLHGITAVADVRSSPRTRVNPDFSQPFIDRVLSEAGIRYIFLGEELEHEAQTKLATRKVAFATIGLPGKHCFRTV
jgi:uncharacterized protein (DUF488 family)